MYSYLHNCVQKRDTDKIFTQPFRLYIEHYFCVPLLLSIQILTSYKNALTYLHNGDGFCIDFALCALTQMCLCVCVCNTQQMPIEKCALHLAHRILPELK